MPSRSSGSTVVRRRLGTALRALREDANIRIEAAARELECSTAKISRLENGLGPARTWEVRVLLSLYGVEDAATREQFDRWASRTKAVGWWEPDSDVIEDDIARYFAVETESVELRMYCTPVLPVLLQSPDYNLAHVHDWNPKLSDQEAQRLADVRRSRQRELLSRDNPLRLVAVVDEGAVHRQVGSARIHADALIWLADLLDDLAAAGRNDIDLRILPFSAGTPGRAMGAFTLLLPREPDLDPITGFTEDLTGTNWFESDAEVAAMSATFDGLRTRCLDPVHSRALLRSSVTSGGVTSFPGYAQLRSPKKGDETRS